MHLITSDGFAGIFWTILDSSRFPLFHSGQVFHQLALLLLFFLRFSSISLHCSPIQFSLAFFMRLESCRSASCSSVTVRSWNNRWSLMFAKRPEVVGCFASAFVCLFVCFTEWGCYFNFFNNLRLSVGLCLSMSVHLSHSPSCLSPSPSLSRSLLNPDLSFPLPFSLWTQWTPTDTSTMQMNNILIINKTCLRQTFTVKRLWWVNQRQAQCYSEHTMMICWDLSARIS